jgi:hypothetical protein
VRVLRNTRLHLQTAVRRQDVIDYYADNIKLGWGHCPPSVISTLDRLGEDGVGVYGLANELIAGAGRDYLTMDQVKEVIRKDIAAHVADLNKIAAV